MKRSSKYQLRNISDMLVLVPLEGNVEMSKLLTLNETGAFIWDYLADEHTLEEIVKEMATNYNADKETIKADLQDYIHDLIAKGVVLNDD